MVIGETTSKVEKERRNLHRKVSKKGFYETGSREEVMRNETGVRKSVDISGRSPRGKRADGVGVATLGFFLYDPP